MTVLCANVNFMLQLLELQKKTNEKTALCLPAPAICVDLKRNLRSPSYCECEDLWFLLPFMELETEYIAILPLFAYALELASRKRFFLLTRWYLICHYLSHFSFSSQLAAQFRNAILKCEIWFLCISLRFESIRILPGRTLSPSEYPTKYCFFFCLEMCRSIGELGTSNYRIE